MKNYLFKLGLQAKKASNKTIKSKKKEQVLKDYCNFLIKNKKRIIAENAKDLKIAKEKKTKRKSSSKTFNQ